MQQPPEKNQSTTEKQIPDGRSTEPEQGPSPKKARRDGQGPGEQKKAMRRQNRRKAESHIYSLYEKVIDRIMASNRISADEVAWGVDDIVDSFCHDEGGRFFDVDYSEFENVCAYLFRYGLHGAGLVRCRTLKAFRRCKELKKVLCRGGPKKLRVVSLGGGPGNDALGFCSALAELGFHDQGREVDVTVVDIIPQWKVCVDQANSLLREQEGFGDLSAMFRRQCSGENQATKVEPTKVVFRHASLPELDAECEGALSAADVILMTKVLFSFERSFEGKTPDIVGKLRSTMRDSALLLLIDSPFRDWLWNEWFEVKYLSPEDDLYRALESHPKFGSSDETSSKARVAVLRKRPTSP